MLTPAHPSLSQLAAHTSHDDVIAATQLQKWNIREDNTLRPSSLSHMLSSLHVPATDLLPASQCFWLLVGPNYKGMSYLCSTILPPWHVETVMYGVLGRLSLLGRELSTHHPCGMAPQPADSPGQRWAEGQGWPQLPGRGQQTQ